MLEKGFRFEIAAVKTSTNKKAIQVTYDFTDFIKKGRRCVYLYPDAVVKDADEEDVFHQQSVRHQCRGDTGCQQHLRQGVVHVLPAGVHVQLLQLTADVRHVWLTQPIKK